MKEIIRGKGGQVAIFVIIAIVIVVGIVVYFLARGSIGVSSIPADLKPVFDYYEGCVEKEVKAAISLAGSQGGYVDVPDYNPGSEYAPFSSQLNFLGFPVPYWYYVSGNGVIKEQQPSMNDIEDGIAKYVGERMGDCNFDEFYSQGFDIQFSEASARITVRDTSVDVVVNSNLVVSKGDESARREIHEVNVNSKLGKFYNLATKIYDKEKEDGIFDIYAEDVLRLYSTVDGVELSCSGKVWKTTDVIGELKEGLEANMAAIKFKGNYYKIDSKEKYYVVDLGTNVDESVNLIYSRSMPTKIEINGEGINDQLMIASPVGIQEGLGVMGFCYSPYHFVYDMSFPVLVQIYNSGELFQFPVVAIVDKNVARKAQFSEIAPEEDIEQDLCEFANKDIEVNLYDSNLNKVDGNVSYQCFSQRCDLGETRGGQIEAKVPSCLNGYIIVRGGSTSEKKELFSSNSQSKADIILDRLHNVQVDLRVGGKPLEGTAIITFASRNGGRTVSTALPDASNMEISEGDYDATVYVYGNSGITIPASKKTQCQELPRTGILGFFGSTKEQCFEIEIPETKIDYALRGGGKGEVYLLDSQLQTGKITIDVDELPIPKTLEELQYNYQAFDSQGVSVE